MKKLTIAFLTFLFVKTSFGQAWMTNSPNILFPVNNAAQMTPIQIGIGLNNPLDRLHLSGGNMLFDNVNAATSGNLFFGSNNVNNNHFRLYYENGAGITGGSVISSRTATGNTGIIFRADMVNGMTERMRINSNGNIGVNVLAPTHGFHTNTSLRFEALPQNNALTQVLVTDAAGVVSWRDASTLGGGGNGWLLNGNNANPADVLGTLNATNLNIVSGGPIRMRVMANNGNVGIAQAAPADRLHVSAGNILTDYVNQAVSGNIFLGSNNVNNNHLRLYYENGLGNPLLDGGVISARTGANGEGLSFRVDNAQGTTHRMRIDANGNVGINTGIINNPTATFHVDAALKPGDPAGISNIRFANLPQGVGDQLVIDAAGYVYRMKSDGADGEMKALRAEVNELKAALNLLLSKNEPSMKSEKPQTANTLLYQNVPNPATGTTSVSYLITEKFNTASIEVRNMQNQKMENIKLNSTIANGSIEINLSPYVSGIYFYSLIVDGKVMDTKKMQVNR